jgi:AraC-like DNA-binding protein
MIDTSLHSSNFYFLLAVFQGIVLSALILFKPHRKKPDLFFGILIFLFSLSLLHIILEESIHAFNARFPFPLDFGFSYGPLAYLHVLYIKNPTRTLQRKDFLHFLPSLLLDGLFFSIFFSYCRTNMEWALQNIALIQTIALSIAILGLLQLIAYTYLMVKESRATPGFPKEFAKVRNWLTYIISTWVTLIVFLLIAISISLLYIEKLDDNSELFYKPLGAIVALCIYVLGYLYLIKYSKVIQNYIRKVGNFKYSIEELAEMKSQLLKAIEQEEYYKDPKITVAKLAREMNWPINKLSVIINDVLQTNFNDLINHYRISAFKEKILAPTSQKYSIEGIAQDIGFKSRASFYRAFKKKTSLTPSEFLTQNKEESQIGI